MTQSNAILRLLRREYGYYSSDAETAYRVDNLINLISDIYIPIFKVWFINDEEEKKKGFKDLVANHYPKFFGFGRRR